MALVLDDTAWQAYLKEAERRARDMTVPMLQIAERMEQRVRNTFRNETDPWGNKWAPWKHPEEIERDRLRRDNASVQKLLDEGTLFASIKRESDSTSATVTAGEEGPAEDYAEVHQFGFDEIAARPYFPMRTREDNVLPAEWYDEAALPLQEYILGAFQ